MVRTYRKSYADQAHELMRSWVVAMELAPGERFVERQMVEKTGFGAMPVREALDRLSQEGLIRTIPRHGYQVAPITEKYVRDFFDVWGPTAATVGRLFCTRATDQELAEIVEMISARAAAQGSGAGEQGVLKLMETTFQRMVEIADNEHLSAIWWRLSGVCARIFTIVYRQDGGRLTDRDPNLFVRGILARDVAAVAASSAGVVEQARKVMEAYFADLAAAAPPVKQRAELVSE